ncbi:hypothetical protein D1872_339330 [compost metagenome]
MLYATFADVNSRSVSSAEMLLVTMSFSEVQSKDSFVLERINEKSVAISFSQYNNSSAKSLFLYSFKVLAHRWTE